MATIWHHRPTGKRTPVLVLRRTPPPLESPFVRLPDGSERWVPSDMLYEDDAIEFVLDSEPVAPAAVEPQVATGPLCACGCGERTRGGKRRPGHNMKDGSAAAARATRTDATALPANPADLVH